MKTRLIIFGVLIFVFLMLAFDAWIFSLAFGAERPANKTIILNFDDGPRPAVLKELLPLLEKYDVRANFFMEGDMVLANKELVRKMHDAGHKIENHSWNHENFKKLFREKGAEAVKSNLNKADDAIFKATGRHPRFFRPPFWKINAEIEQVVKSLGYTIMKLGNPDINTLDYEDAGNHRPPEVLIERVKKIIADSETQGKFKHVLVFHELPITVEALKTLIPYFQNQGYKFIKLDEK
ncbi:MAG: polysaccharide deacetylase family protein [bacterium]|nr:polysaccharide deacetylase family protein [bacterium]